MSSRKFLRRALLSLAGFGLVTPLSHAASIDPGFVVPLYTLGTYTDSQGAIYSNADIHPAGEGVFQPFERIHANQNSPYEQGFNTNAGSKELDNLTHGDQTWNHAVSLSSLATVTLNGTAYYEFSLNLNQTGNSGSFVSLDKVQIFQTNVAAVTGYQGAKTTGATADNFIGNASTPLAVKVYDEDLGKVGDTTINLNSRLNNGQGTGTADMTLLVPKTLFSNNLPDVVLYSAFGDPNASKPKNSNTPGFFAVTGGHEDWNFNAKPSAVPVPAPLYAAAMLLGVCGLVRSRRTTAQFS